jgi:SAM-dependent methyltransferase
MQKYLKAFFHIFKNYHFYSIPILLSEAIFYLKYNNTVNKFKYLNDDFLSDSIPCPYYFLKRIKSFAIKKNLNSFCDLGSGYGKVLYFFGSLNDYKIDGVEFDKEIYLNSTVLNNKNIEVFNANILELDFNNTKYDMFIMNDPLKKKEDLLELILKIKKFSKKSYLVFINLDEKKIEIINHNLKLIDSFIVSKNKNILFCSAG